MTQDSIFNLMYERYKITKPIRLIELFSGYGSQHFALEYLGVNFEHWKCTEWAVKSIQAYKDAHYQDDKKDYSKDLSKEELIDYLYNKHISMDYNEPMKLDQIKRKDETWLRTVYNNIQATKNTVDITQTKASDLEIVDTDKYTYIMTYSFPCQDLSLAGLGKGMARDSGTRSGMLWEVERILDECTELPQILLMENVPEVKGTNNVKYFNEWQEKLESLGYKNYHQNLIATDYGIPQTRNRTFMISILGNYSYTFPNAIPLKLKLKDMLENNVDEKYYLSDIQINTLQNTKFESMGIDRVNNINDSCNTLTTMNGGGREPKIFIGNKALKETLEKSSEIKNGSFIDSYNKNIRDDDMAGTITTRVSDSNNTFIAIKEATKQGYAIAHDGDGVYINRPHQKRGVVQKDKMQTLKTSPDTGVVDNLRIRKLTPKECFRLMGVKDEDYELIAKNQSDSSLYHLAGDSIVVNVLMAIFKELL
jgi:DNA (cytosine-5)-methyltransferase 1